MRGETNKTIKVILLLLTIVLMSFLNLQAQEISNTDTIAYSVDIDNVVVTGTAVPTSSKKALHKVKTITSAEIQQKGQTQLTEVLAGLPNVRVNYDPILGASVKLRGVSADNVNILIDGVPVVGRLDGAIDISQINIQDIQKIELIEGPLSSIYGNNAAGGVINIVTKKSQRDKLKILVDNQYEYPGINNHTAKIGFQHSDFFVSGGVNYFKHQLYDLDSTRVHEEFIDLEGNSFLYKKYPWNPKERISYNGVLRYNLSEVSSITYKYDQSEEEVIDLGVITRPQFMPYAWDKTYDTHRKDHSLSIHDERGGLFIDGVFASNSFNRFFTTDRFEFEDNRTVDSFRTIDTTIVKAYFGKLSVASSYDGPLNFLAGINYNKEIGGGERIQDLTADNPDEAENTDLALFGSLTYNYNDRFTLSTNARAANNKLYGNTFNPGVQLKWNASNLWTVRAGWATGFRAPSLKERFINFIDVNHNIVGNPDVQPESSIDYSLNATYENMFASKQFQLNFNTYYNTIDSKIILSQFEPGRFNYQNLESFTSYGIGTDFQYGNDQWKIRSALSLGYWNSGISDTNETTPVFDFVNGFSYRLPFNINSDLQYRYVGADPSFTESNGEVLQSSIDPYVLMDLSFTKRLFNNQILLGTGVKNIFDVRQTNISGSAASGPHTSGLPSQNVNQGRTLFVKMAYQFGS